MLMLIWAAHTQGINRATGEGAGYLRCAEQDGELAVGDGPGEAPAPAQRCLAVFGLAPELAVDRCIALFGAHPGRRTGNLQGPIDDKVTDQKAGKQPW